MKTLLIKKLIFLLFISLFTIAGYGKIFTAISSLHNTFKCVIEEFNTGIVSMRVANYVPDKNSKCTNRIDGYDKPLNYQASFFKVNILPCNSNYNWQGTEGNLNTEMKIISSENRFSHFMKCDLNFQHIGSLYKSKRESSQVLSQFKISKLNQGIELSA